MKQSKKKTTMSDVFKNPRYRGKHIILAAGKIFTAKTGEGASKILEKIRKKFPKETPEIAYLPKVHSLTLGFIETFNTEFFKSRTVIFKD